MCGSPGTGELLLILVVVLLVFGPRRLPELGNLFGKAMRQFQRAMSEIQEEIADIETITDLDNDEQKKGET